MTDNELESGYDRLAKTRHEDAHERRVLRDRALARFTDEELTDQQIIQALIGYETRG